MTGHNLKRSSIAAALAVAVLLQGCGNTIDARQTKNVNGLLYKVNDSDPFTGTVTNFPLNSIARVMGQGSCTVEYKKGQMDGKAVCKSEAGIKLAESEWQAGKKHGLEQLWYEKNGNLNVSVRWVNGKMDGLEERYNPLVGKLISKVSWSAGEKSGEDKRWDATGETLLVDLIWKDGKQAGIEKIGESESYYKEGQLDGVQRRWQTGSAPEFLNGQRTVEMLGGGANFAGLYGGSFIVVEQSYKNGLPDGPYRSWHGNKNLKEEVSYQGGRRVGLYRSWDERKILREVAHYTVDPAFDREHGQFGGRDYRRLYDENGKVTSEECFINGQLRYSDCGEPPASPAPSNDSATEAKN